MNRLVLVPLVLYLLIPSAVAAQVKIDVAAKHYRVQEEIHARVENTGGRSVTFCVELGQASPRGAEIESTPSPFWVQEYSDSKWGTLMIGPDVGSIRAVVVLETGESKEFPFRLNDSGRMRLRLNYWYGSILNMDCYAPPKRLKLATSSIFTID